MNIINTTMQATFDNSMSSWSILEQGEDTVIIVACYWKLTHQVVTGIKLLVTKDAKVTGG